MRNPLLDLGSFIASQPLAVERKAAGRGSEIRLKCDSKLLHYNAKGISLVRVCLKNRLSTYSIAILIGLSALTASFVIHNPFAPKASGAPVLASPGSNVGSAPGPAAPSSGQNSSSPAGLLLHGTPAQHSSDDGGGDDGYGVAAAGSHNGTRFDD